MAVTKDQKKEIVAKLKSIIKEAKSIGFVQSSGVTVAEFDEIRNNVREEEAYYMIAKKTLIKIAIKEELGLDIDIKDLPGQIGIVCSTIDTVGGLSKVNEFIKASEKDPKMSWEGVIVDGEFKGAEEAKLLASMPSRDTLLGRLVGSMKSPLSALARFFDAAAKEVETQGKETVGQLEVESSDTTDSQDDETPAKDETTEKKEVKKDEEVKESTEKKEEKTEEAKDDATKKKEEKTEETKA